MKYLYALLFIIFASGTAVYAQDGKQALSPRVSAKSDNAEVSYGQPSKRGRVIFGDLVPYGQIWRTGANEATEITFKKDCTFGGKKVKAGTYTMFTVPAQKEWTIILNAELKQWGAFGYEDIKNKDVLHITAPAQKTGAVNEKFVINITKDVLEMSWDQTAVAVPMKF